MQGSAADVGTARYGIPLTEAELADFERRLEIQRIAHERLDAAARGRDDFAGRYIDQEAGGKVVVLTTGDAAAVLRELLDVEPRLAGELIVREVEFTETELSNASRSLFSDAGQHLPGITVYQTWVDTKAGEVVVTVAPEKTNAAAALADAISEELGGIPIRIEPGTAVEPSACATRYNCHTPMRAGIRITSDAGTCTMGFNLRSGTTRQFMTAHHCNNGGWYHWYHEGYGFLGSRTATLAPNGIDIMRVSMPASQSSRQVYITASQYITVSTVRWPNQWEVACGSLGKSADWRCGTITTTSTSWSYLGDPEGRTYHGGRVDFWNQKGDSGSPIWLQSGGHAVGILNGQGSGQTLFAVMAEALVHWSGWSL